MGGSADVRRVRDGIDIAAEKEKREDKKAGKKRERRKQDGKEKRCAETSGGGSVSEGDRRVNPGGTGSGANRVEYVAPIGADLHMRRKGGGHGYFPQIYRKQKAGGDCHFDSGNRPGAASDRGAGNGEVVAVRASDCRH